MIPHLLLGCLTLTAASANAQLMFNGQLDQAAFSMIACDALAERVSILPIRTVTVAMDTAVDLGTLEILWAGVIDNGEGDDRPHGPFGSLHVLIYPGTAGCPGDQKSYRGYLSHTYLPGPSKGEWRDGDAMQMRLPIHDWGSGYDDILVVVYESDPYRVGRSHDMLFCYRVQHSATTGGYIVLGDTYRSAANDALWNCQRRGVPWLTDEVWNGGLGRGMPKMFLQLQTQ
jgi:hypothetical protein